MWVPFEVVRTLSKEIGRKFDSLGSFWSQNLMMMVQRPGQAQDWGLLLYLMTIILSYHRHQQVSKTNRPSKLRSALTEHQRDFYINTGLMMPPWPSEEYLWQSHAELICPAQISCDDKRPLSRSGDRKMMLQLKYFDPGINIILRTNCSWSVKNLRFQ